MSDTPPPTTPPGSLASLSTQGRALWAKLPARARTATVASTVAIIALVGYLMLSGGGGSWRPVTDGLTGPEARELIGALDNRNIPHRLRANAVVEVPSARLDEARLEAVMLGIPRSTLSLDSFDKLPRFSTTKQEQVWIQSATQGQLAHAIETLGPIERAQINLAFAKDSVFVTGGAPATASVTVHLRPGATLSHAQVAGIKEIVANGVSGLSVDHVKVVDQNANLLSEASESEGDEQTAMGQRLADEVRQMLETVTGVGKVKVVAQVELDRRTINKTEESFADPKIVGQVLVTTPGAVAATASGIAGTTGNLPGATATTGSVPTASTVVSSTTNNLLGRTVVLTAEPATRIARISVVVLLADGVNEDGEPVVRTPDEIAKVTALAHGAAGLDDTRGDKLTVEAMTFVAPEVAVIAPAPASKLPVSMPVAIGGGAVVLIAAALLVGRRRRRSSDASTVRIALPAPVAELERALAGPGAGQAARPPALTAGRTLEERVLGAVKGDVQRASRVLASWLAEPDPTPAPPAGKGARA